MTPLALRTHPRRVFYPVMLKAQPGKSILQRDPTPFD
jgi:hypothetical protein